MSDSDMVTQCMASLQDTVESIGDFSGRSMYVYGPDDMLAVRDQIQLPCVGIAYLGLRGSPDKGIMSTLYAEVYVLGDIHGNLGLEDMKGYMTSLLSKLREGVKGTRAPTGHFWHFEFEHLDDYNTEELGYTQRWSVSIAT